MDKPYSKSAEMAVIGAVLLDAPTVLNEVISKIKQEYFFFYENKIIFRCIEEMF